MLHNSAILYILSVIILEWQLLGFLVKIISIPDKELFAGGNVGCIAAYFVNYLMFPVGVVAPPPPHFKQCFDLFAVAEGWLLFVCLVDIICLKSIWLWMKLFLTFCAYLFPWHRFPILFIELRPRIAMRCYDCFWRHLVFHMFCLKDWKSSSSMCTSRPDIEWNERFILRPEVCHRSANGFSVSQCSTGTCYKSNFPVSSYHDVMRFTGREFHETIFLAFRHISSLLTFVFIFRYECTPKLVASIFKCLHQC